MNISKNLTGANNMRYRFDQLPRSEAITYVVLLTLESLVIIIGNAIVIAAFRRARQLREKKCYWFCVNLAVADLLLGVLAGPYMVYDFITRSDLVKFTRYSLQVYLAGEAITNFLQYASFINLTLISLERMYAILWPLKHRVLGARNYHVMIGISWTLPLFAPTSIIADMHHLIPFLATTVYIWLATDCFLSLIIVISYASIWIKLKFFRHTQNHVTTAQDRKLTMSLFLVTAASMMTIVTGRVLSEAANFQMYGGVLSWNRYFYIMNSAILLIFANSMLNPIIYAFRIPQLRRAALRLICRRTTEIQEPAIEMRNRAEVINR